MKYLISVIFLWAMSVSALAAPIHYSGDISGSGNYSGSLDINFGWIDPPFGLNSWGDHVDLWQIDGSAGDTLSLALNSDELALGFSLYYGEISATDLLVGLFDNDGNIGSANYLTGRIALEQHTNTERFCTRLQRILYAGSGRQRFWWLFRLQLRSGCCKNVST